MKYTTTMTSKGTVTIAAPLRKALGFKPGQKLNVSLGKNNQIVMDSGVSMQQFEATRALITKKIPSHLKGLQGEALRQARADAWTADHRDKS